MAKRSAQAMRIKSDVKPFNSTRRLASKAAKPPPFQAVHLSSGITAFSVENIPRGIEQCYSKAEDDLD
jgi:hypothetical protein